MNRTTRSWTFQQGLPEWAGVALLFITMALEAWDVWHEYRAPKAEPITFEDCYSLCAWTGSTPKAWGSYSCECFPPAEGR